MCIHGYFYPLTKEGLSIQPFDKFGNSIYSHVFQTLLSIGEKLIDIGYSESIQKPNLFFSVRKFEWKDTIYECCFFADMRGTEIIKIWQEPVPLFWLDARKIPSWIASRMKSEELGRLKEADIPYRFSYESYFSIADPSVDIDPIDALMNESPFKEIIEDIPFNSTYPEVRDTLHELKFNENGYCKICGEDFHDYGLFCSNVCRDTLKEKCINAILVTLPSCEGCGVLLHKNVPPKRVKRKYDLPEIRQPFIHHTDYETDTTVLVCSQCHNLIHSSSTPADMMHLQPESPRPKIKKRKTKLVLCSSCSGMARVELDYSETTALCSKCGQRKSRTQKLVPCTHCNGKPRVDLDVPDGNAICSRCKVRQKSRRRRYYISAEGAALKAKFPDAFKIQKRDD